ncbi:MAG: rubredoxin [Woeseia sp.]
MSAYLCPECEYRFDEQEGDDNEGYSPGTPFTSLPDDFACPVCAVRYKEDFVKISN